MVGVVSTICWCDARHRWWREGFLRVFAVFVYLIRVFSGLLPGWAGFQTPPRLLAVLKRTRTEVCSKTAEHTKMLVSTLNIKATMIQREEPKMIAMMKKSKEENQSWSRESKNQNRSKPKGMIHQACYRHIIFSRLAFAWSVCLLSLPLLLLCLLPFARGLPESPAWRGVLFQIKRFELIVGRVSP